MGLGVQQGRYVVYIIALPSKHVHSHDKAFMAAIFHSTMTCPRLSPLGCKLCPGVFPLGWRLTVARRWVVMHIPTCSLLPPFGAAAVGSRL